MSVKNNDKLMELLNQATRDSVITCPECFNNLEPDAPSCSCGWENILREMGFI